VDGRRLSFEEIGIFNGVFVMKDRETGTFWSHYTGEALEGPQVGTRLEWVQVGRSQFGRMVQEHPQATMPAKKKMQFREIPPMSGRDEAMGDGMPDEFIPTLPKNIDQLPRHTHGLGVAVGSDRRFYALDTLAGEPVVNDQIGDVPVVVLVQDGTEAAAAYSRCIDGRELTFDKAEWQGLAALRDRETRTVWRSDGSAASGELEGRSLVSIRSIVTDWYGWAAYFQNTDIYRVDDR